MPFQVRLTALHLDHITQGDLQLEDLLDRDHTLAAADRRRQAVEHRRLARLGRPGDQDVEPGVHTRIQVPRRLGRQRPSSDQVLEVMGPHDELADVHGPVPSGDVGDHHMQSRPVGKRGIHERRAQVQTPPRGPQHALHQIADLLLREDDAGQLGDSTACAVHLVGRIDPDLLDGVIIQQRLERTEAGDRVSHDAHGLHVVVQLGQRARQRTRLIVLRCISDEASDSVRLLRRVQPSAPHQFADFVFQDPNGIHGIPSMSAL